MKSVKLKLIGFILLTFITACSPLMSNFDQVSYQQVTSLKVDALSVMDEAVTDYAAHSAEVKDLQLKVDKAIEYDKHRPHNEITNEMWALLNDPQKNLLGGFLVKWQHDGKCSAVYITEKKKQISFSFDQIAELESKKIKTVNN
jgi:hypothetical protein